MTNTPPPNRIPWPPILYISAAAAAILAGIFIPLPWLPAPAKDLLFAVGIICIVAAIALDFSAMRQMHSAKTPILPTKSAEHLITKGAFAVSRNPIYVGNTLLMTGVALMAGNVWFILFGLCAAFATQKLAIEREERHLTQRFGKRYIDYTKRVRRWI